MTTDDNCPIKCNGINAVEISLVNRHSVDSEGECEGGFRHVAQCAENGLETTASPNEVMRRLWRKVRRGPADQCWPWLGAKSSFGHGRLKIDGKLVSPHWVVFETRNGAIPSGPGYHGVVVRHTCDNPSCCNPRHLVLGTQRDNVADMVQRGRNPQMEGPLRAGGLG